MLLLVKLKFRNALKIGSGDIAQGEEFRGILHSDTLFSAICNEWARLNGGSAVEALIAGVTSDPPSFRISSAFPFYLDDYYLATPYGTDEVYRDKLKNVPFVELYDFLDIASGDIKKVVKKGLKNPLDSVAFKLIAPRVSIDRISAATNIFSTTSWQFKEGGGLFFLIDLKDESLRDKLLLCIRLLGESGLGGDRSVGYGLFDAEIQYVDDAEGWATLFRKKEGRDVVHYTLSLCFPLNGEAQEAVSYQLLTRKGWIYSHSSTKQMKRRECKMFSEGSLFRSPVRGEIINVTPTEFRSEHNVYRYGLGMTIDLAV